MQRGRMHCKALCALGILHARSQGQILHLVNAPGILHATPCRYCTMQMHGARCMQHPADGYCSVQTQRVLCMRCPEDTAKCSLHFHGAILIWGCCMQHASTPTTLHVFSWGLILHCVNTLCKKPSLDAQLLQMHRLFCKHHPSAKYSPLQTRQALCMHHPTPDIPPILQKCMGKEETRCSQQPDGVLQSCTTAPCFLQVDA